LFDSLAAMVAADGRTGRYFSNPHPRNASGLGGDVDSPAVFVFSRDGLSRSLAGERPPAADITEFISGFVGGVLGGVQRVAGANLFRTVAEYPLVIVLPVCCARREAPDRNTGLALAGPGAAGSAGSITAGLALLIRFTQLTSINLQNAVIVGLPAIACLRSWTGRCDLAWASREF